jgi:hypothetical protein
MTRTLERVVNRAAEVTGVYGHLRTTPDRVDALALATLRARAADQQLELFARWCYRLHEGQLVHIMPDGQIPAGQWTPWGSSGKSKMTKTDRRILRRWLVGLSQHRHFPPWRYQSAERRWYVDLVRYPTEADALAWLAKYRIAAADWLNLRLSMRPNRRR